MQATVFRSSALNRWHVFVRLQTTVNVCADGKYDASQHTQLIPTGWRLELYFCPICQEQNSTENRSRGAVKLTHKYTIYDVHSVRRIFYKLRNITCCLLRTLTDDEKRVQLNTRKQNSALHCYYICTVIDWRGIQVSVFVIQVVDVTSCKSQYIKQEITGKVPSAAIHALKHCRSITATRPEHMHLFPRFYLSSQLLASSTFKQTLDEREWSASRLCRFNSGKGARDTHLIGGAHGLTAGLHAYDQR
jgi:hypothetical protein